MLLGEKKSTRYKINITLFTTVQKKKITDKDSLFHFSFTII